MSQTLDGEVGNMMAELDAELDADKLSLGNDAGKKKARLWGKNPIEVCFVTEKYEVCVTTVELTLWIDYCNSKYHIPPTLQGDENLTMCLDYLLYKTLKNEDEKWRLNPTSNLCPILNPHDLLDWIENRHHSSMSLDQYVEDNFMKLVERRQGRKYKYKPLSDGTNSYDHSSYTTDYMYAGRRRGRGKKTIKRKRNIMSRRSKTGRKSRRSRRA